MSKSFEQWINWMESCHPVEIDLGLERCNAVLKRLLKQPLNCPVVTIAGTNGKGSTVAVLESLAIQSNLKPLTYTSPHLIDYRERVQFNAQWLTKAEHIKAFEAVDLARGDETLTYFEIATLAAIKCAELLKPDILILETGLGGRLDAVNTLKADIAIITTVDFDHQDWLGDNIIDIAREKAGIIHKDKIAIVADENFPQPIIDEIKVLTQSLYIIGKAFKTQALEDKWQWQDIDNCWEFDYLTFPESNSAAAIQAWKLLTEQDFIVVDERENACDQFNMISKALKNIRLTARFETVLLAPKTILDVAHNPQAFRTQIQLLKKTPVEGKTHIILGMLKDKNTVDCLEVLKPFIDCWYLASINIPRGLAAEELDKLLTTAEIDSSLAIMYKSPLEAYKAACDNASKNDRILVTGSFYTVAPVLAYIHQQNYPKSVRIE